MWRRRFVQYKTSHFGFTELRSLEMNKSGMSNVARVHVLVSLYATEVFLIPHLTSLYYNRFGSVHILISTNRRSLFSILYLILPFVTRPLQLPTTPSWKLVNYSNLCPRQILSLSHSRFTYHYWCASLNDTSTGNATTVQPTLHKRREYVRSCAMNSWYLARAECMLHLVLQRQRAVL